MPEGAGPRGVAGFVQDGPPQPASAAAPAVAERRSELAGEAGRIPGPGRGPRTRGEDPVAGVLPAA